MLGTENGTDSEIYANFNDVDDLPQMNTGVGSATSIGSFTLNGVPFDDVFDPILGDGDVLVWSIAVAVTAVGESEFGDMTLYPLYFDFGFGDFADGMPSTPSDSDSGQMAFFTSDFETYLDIDLANNVFVTASVDVVPEPGTLLLLGTGLTGLAVHGRRRSPRIR